jgi:hypothetical protein
MHETIAYVIIRLVSVVVDVAGARLWRVTSITQQLNYIE